MVVAHTKMRALVETPEQQASQQVLLLVSLVRWAIKLPLVLVVPPAPNPLMVDKEVKPQPEVQAASISLSQVRTV